MTDIEQASEACDPEIGQNAASTLGICGSNSIGYYVPSPADTRQTAMHMAISAYMGHGTSYIPQPKEVIERAKAYEDFLNELIDRT